MRSLKRLKRFLESERSSGFTLIICTIISLVLANSLFGDSYALIWDHKIAGTTVAHWINDGLMTLFFLLIGLELKREFLQGQFRQVRNALLPVFAAVGGMLLPAGVHLLLNYGTPTQAGAGIPIATDAAFALAILSLVGKRAPLELKALLMAIAVIDDLFAIIVIAVFYTKGLALTYLGLSLLVFGLLMLCNKLGVRSILIYTAGGLLMWYFILHSGVHATISGVLLAIAIPFVRGVHRSPSIIFHRALHAPVHFFVLPLFALSNTAIIISGSLLSSLSTPNAIGIVLGLLAGKPLGVSLFSLLAMKTCLGSLPPVLNFKHVVGIGFLAAIGFTISIFISMLAFKEQVLIEGSKIAVLFSSVIAALLAYTWLHVITKRVE